MKIHQIHMADCGCWVGVEGCVKLIAIFQYPCWLVKYSLEWVIPRIIERFPHYFDRPGMFTNKLSSQLIHTLQLAVIFRDRAHFCASIGTPERKSTFPESNPQISLLTFAKNMKYDANFVYFYGRRHLGICTAQHEIAGFPAKHV